MSLGAALHLGLHALIPALLAWLLFRERFLWATCWLLAGWAIDIDHLLATPIYSAGRCSLGFHPLHTLPAILLYATLLVAKPLRLLGLGLLIHIALDGIDCLRMACKVQSLTMSTPREHHFQGNSVMGRRDLVLLTSHLSEQSHYARMQA